MLEIDVSLHAWLRYAHIAAGAVGLVLFWIPVFAPKGSRLHIACGKGFVACGYFVAASALVSCGWALVAPLSFLGIRDSTDSQVIGPIVAGVSFLMSILGVLAIWLLAALLLGVQVIRTRREPERLRRSAALKAIFSLSVLASGALGGLGAVALMMGSGRHFAVFVVLGLIGIADAIKQFRFLANPRPTPMAWWYVHMECMLGAGIAFHTAFFVFGFSRLAGVQLEGPAALIPWLLPTAIGAPGITLWVRSYRKRFGELDQPPHLGNDQRMLAVKS